MKRRDPKISSLQGTRNALDHGLTIIKICFLSGRWKWAAIFLPVLFLVFFGSMAFSHPVGGIPDMVIQIHIQETELLCEMVAPCPILKDTFRLEIPESIGVPASASPDMISFSANIFSEKKMICLDGIPVKPIITSFEFSVVPNPFAPDEPGISIGTMKFRFPSKGIPRQIALKMEFPAPSPIVGGETSPNALYRLTEVLGVFHTGDARRVVSLTAREPEFIWHAEKSIPKPLTMQVNKDRTGESFSLSPLWIFVAILVPLGIWIWRTRSFTRGVKTSLTSVALLLGCLFTTLSPVVVPNPFHVSQKPPEASEALAIFSALHKNIYRAFDYTKESDIYDTLATSVDGRLLDWIYNEIYQSLVLRTEGGAVCQIQSVETLDRSLLKAANTAEIPGAFTVHCRWKVRGAVEHWGHVHSRTNVYEADYTVAPVGGVAWKIVDVEVLAQEREENPTSSGASGTLPLGQPGGPLVGSSTDTEPVSNKDPFLVCKELAEQGIATAQFKLAERYFKGLGVLQDKPEALRWLRKVAAVGNPEAMKLLGLYLYTGNGVPKNATEAFSFFQKAAEKGDPEGFYYLGVMYDSGDGAPRNLSEAIRCYRVAAEQDHPMAQFNLGFMYLNGEGVEKSYPDALQWFRKSAQNGAPSAQFNLGIMYVKGMGVAPNLPEAFVWLKKAAANGNKDAQYNLGIMYTNGLGVASDAQEADRWFRLSGQPKPRSGPQSR